MRSGAGFAQESGDVKLNSSLADEKRFADFGNALASKNAIQHLGLALCQPVTGAVIRGGEWGRRRPRRSGGANVKTQGPAVKNNDQAAGNG